MCRKSGKDKILFFCRFRGAVQRSIVEADDPGKEKGGYKGNDNGQDCINESIVYENRQGDQAR